MWQLIWTFIQVIEDQIKLEKAREAELDMLYQ
jgi:hypothetical protein